MIYKTISPTLVDILEIQLKEQGWELVHQDGGQGHFIGWSYLKRWQKRLDEKTAEVTLHFSENQGEQSAHLEMNPAAKDIIDQMVDALESDS